MRPNPILLFASMFGLLLVHGEATAGLIQLTGSTPVVIDDDRYAGDSVSVYQSAPVTLLPGAEIGGFLIGYQFA
jgi:hypothetical protein